MQNNIVTAIIFIALVGFAFSAPVASAQLGGNGSLSNSSSGIQNPLSGGQEQTITSVLTGIIKWMLGLVGFLALIALIIGGGRMVIDFGNEEQVERGKTTVKWAVIGLAVVILSYALLNIVVNEVLGGASGGSNGGNSYESNPGNVQLPTQ